MRADGSTEQADQYSADGSTEPVTEGRKLTAGGAPSTFLVLPGLQTHEFPNGHTCANIDAYGNGFRQVLPVDNDGADSWAPSLSTTSAEVSLVSVGSDWSTNRIQRMSNAFKIVHDASCTSPPSLALQLDTSVSGSLTLNGQAVNANIQMCTLLHADKSAGAPNSRKQLRSTASLVGGPCASLDLDPSTSEFAPYWLLAVGWSANLADARDSPPQTRASHSCCSTRIAARWPGRWRSRKTACATAHCWTLGSRPRQRGRGPASITPHWQGCAACERAMEDGASL
jgi:hypothetical protein